VPGRGHPGGQPGKLFSRAGGAPGQLTRSSATGYPHLPGVVTRLENSLPGWPPGSRTRSPLGLPGVNKTFPGKDTRKLTRSNIYRWPPGLPTWCPGRSTHFPRILANHYQLVIVDRVSDPGHLPGSSLHPTPSCSGTGPPCQLDKINTGKVLPVRWYFFSTARGAITVTDP
jgi:hypothetical protein